MRWRWRVSVKWTFHLRVELLVQKLWTLAILALRNWRVSNVVWITKARLIFSNFLTQQLNLLLMNKILIISCIFWSSFILQHLKYILELLNAIILGSDLYFKINISQSLLLSYFSIIIHGLKRSNLLILFFFELF